MNTACLIYFHTYGYIEICRSNVKGLFEVTCLFLLFSVFVIISLMVVFNIFLMGYLTFNS